MKDFRLFTLTAPTHHPIDYLAGQYVTLSEHTGTDEVRRSYSMTSAPLLNEPMKIGVKRLANGAFSRFLFMLKAGNVLTSTGVGGLFTLPQWIRADQQFVFLAAGTGITPVLSIIKTLLAFYPHNKVVLIYGNASPERAAFINELIALKKNHSAFAVELLFSNNKDLRRARLNPELLFQLLVHFNITSAALFYTCGPEAYMRMCLFALREAGVADEQIKRENFVVRKKEFAYHRPPDEEAHNVAIEINGKIISLQVKYPLSILGTARRGGVALPYSCEAGICGNCVARCITGRVWMSNNEVLTAGDLRKGMVLTCTGYPVGGDVLLKIG